MSTEALLQSLQSSALAEWMRYTVPAMQVVEATHVLAAVVVLGTVLIVDLRLLGLADASRGFTPISRETLPLTWVAFAVAAITGSLMFTTSAETYFANPAFRLKALALLAAGLNMAVFQLVTAHDSAAWSTPPRAARIAGLLSILLWAAVVLLGRWIGFTKGYDFTIPPGVDLAQGAYCWAHDPNVKRVVGAGSPAASFTNSWVNNGAGYADAAYYFSEDGEVVIEGSVKNGTALTSVFTLPTGYRPPTTRRFAVDSNGAYGMVTCTLTGRSFNQWA